MRSQRVCGRRQRELFAYAALTGGARPSSSPHFCVEDQGKVERRGQSERVFFWSALHFFSYPERGVND